MGPPDPGLDVTFLHRVYRTSAVLGLLAAVFLWEGLGRRVALGWLWGAGLSLLLLWGMEWTVLRTVRPGARSTAPLLGIGVAKLLAGMGLLVLAFLAAQRGWIALLWVLPGVALPHLVIVLKLAGRAVTRLLGTHRPPSS